MCTFEIFVKFIPEKLRIYNYKLFLNRKLYQKERLKERPRDAWGYTETSGSESTDKFFFTFLIRFTLRFIVR